MRRRLIRLLAIAVVALAAVASAWQTRAMVSVAVPRMELVVHLQRSGQPIPNAVFSVYRVGDFDEETGRVTLDAPWSGFEVSGVLDQRGWARASQNMADSVAYVGAAPIARGATGADGMIAFSTGEGIEHGLYLVVGDDVDFDGKTYSSLPFLVSMPSLDFEEKTWCYEVIAEPKPGERIPPGNDPSPAPTPSSGGSGSNAPWPFGPLPKTGDLLASWGPWLGLGIIIATLGFRLREDS